MDLCNMIETEKKCIALIGDGRRCKHFYLEFQSRMDIKYFITANIDSLDEDVKNFFEDCAMHIIPLKKQYFEKHNILLVLCTEHRCRDAYDKLLFQNSIEWGSDYIDDSYIVQYFRYKDNIKLEEKNIWIFGAGNNGKYFYEQHKEVYHICGFLSNFEDEKELEGLPVLRPDDIVKLNDFYIVICSDADVAIANQISELGMVGGKNYSFAELLPKKLFIAIGTCQIIKVIETLQYNSSFTGYYHIDSYFENIYDPCSDADNRRLKKYGKFCDVVFYNIANAGTTEFRDYEHLIHAYYKNAVQLFMPFYYFKGQMIQATDTINTYATRLQTGEWMWFRGDQEINRMIENNNSVEEIFTKVSSDNYWTQEKIIENFKKELKKVEILDRFSSFPIKQFIERNYQQISVFIDGTHFSYHLCQYLANEIAKKLHMKPRPDLEIKNRNECNSTSIMPVYPCVQKALGMKIKEYYQFYNIEKDVIEYLNMEEFVKRYIQYVIRVRDIRKKYGTIMAW